ncbi:aromatic ring-hydroxylating oxygenase subunit alpha [Zhongshania sp. BJYM1]|uniref:aromatic ring-hydroxylating oxygenase subunit alpha n=1 Tax=Zhongshania aquatica TaxID=2965069 RepID=UPI0022B332A5|nr:aromatic ring-hydroxylating dioxygenase subunit alpha [Marortus sp. BJYM1]
MSNKFDFEYTKGYTSYPEVTDPQNPAAKAPYIDHGTAKPDKTRYYSQQEHDLEWQHVWRKSWTFAGLSFDLKQPGDYLRYDLGKESFIVVRTGNHENDVKAYYNVCPHRGNYIVTEDFGHVKDNFYCNFHGWKWGLDGENTKVKDDVIFREETLKNDLCLRSVRCEIWNSLIFINMDADAKPLIDFLDVIPEHLKNYPFGEFRVLRDFEAEWPANWKTAAEAFLEFYHSDDVHPEVIPISSTLETQYDLYQNGVSRMIIQNCLATCRMEDQDEVNPYLKMFVEMYGGDNNDYKDLKGFEYKKAFIDTKRKWGKKQGYSFFDNLTDDQIADDWNYHVFPNMTLNVFSDGLLIQSWKPHASDPRKSYYSVLTLCLPVSDPNTRVMDINSFGPDSFGPPGWDGSERPARFRPNWDDPEEANAEVWGRVMWQDAERIPNVQKGIESDAFSGAILCEAEIRIRHYLNEIDRLIGRE